MSDNCVDGIASVRDASAARAAARAGCVAFLSPETIASNLRGDNANAHARRPARCRCRTDDVFLLRCFDASEDIRCCLRRPAFMRAIFITASAAFVRRIPAAARRPLRLACCSPVRVARSQPHWSVSNRTTRTDSALTVIEMQTHARPRKLLSLARILVSVALFTVSSKKCKSAISHMNFFADLPPETLPV